MQNRLLFASLAIFLCFVFFTLLVHLDLFTAFDFNTTVRLQDKISGGFVFPFSLLSLIGSAEIASLFLLVLVFMVRTLSKFYVLFLYGVMTIIELFGKFFVDHKGPPFMFFKYDIGFYFPSSHVQPGSSYPSGHMARTAFIAGLLFILVLGSKKQSRQFKFALFLGLFLFVVVMFVSRIYLGEHWTTDVIGGALIGASFGLLGALNPLRFINSLRFKPLLFSSFRRRRN